MGPSRFARYFHLSGMSRIEIATMSIGRINGSAAISIEPASMVSWKPYYQSVLQYHDQFQRATLSTGDDTPEHPLVPGVFTELS